jgi:hypothetical protein
VLSKWQPKNELCLKALPERAIALVWRRGGIWVFVIAMSGCAALASGCASTREVTAPVARAGVPDCHSLFLQLKDIDQHGPGDIGPQVVGRELNVASQTSAAAVRVVAQTLRTRDLAAPGSVRALSAIVTSYEATAKRFKGDVGGSALRDGDLVAFAGLGVRAYRACQSAVESESRGG